MSEPLADRFAKYSCQLRYEDLPAPVVHEVKRRFIDSFATVTTDSGSRSAARPRRTPGIPTMKKAARHPNCEAM